MGVLLDSSVLIAAERRSLSPFDALKPITVHYPGEPLGISVISVLELAHGERRADTVLRTQARSFFLDAVLEVIQTFPITTEIARRTGRLDGELARLGQKLAFPDLLIGVTALELGWPVLTANVRHFNRIPGLSIIHQP